jgi:hypothetical protein
MARVFVGRGDGFQLGWVPLIRVALEEVFRAGTD